MKPAFLVVHCDSWRGGTSFLPYWFSSVLPGYNPVQTRIIVRWSWTLELLNTLRKREIVRKAVFAPTRVMSNQLTLSVERCRQLFVQILKYGSPKEETCLSSLSWFLWQHMDGECQDLLKFFIVIHLILDYELQCPYFVPTKSKTNFRQNKFSAIAMHFWNFSQNQVKMFLSSRKLVETHLKQFAQMLPHASLVCATCSAFSTMWAQSSQRGVGESAVSHCFVLTLRYVWKWDFVNWLELLVNGFNPFIHSA